MQTVRLGSKGTVVEVLQKFLKLKIDGDFGPNTEKVVKEWQKTNGLLQDGVVGPASWKIILAQKIQPVLDMYDPSESESQGDPEEEMKVKNVDETTLKCSNLTELMLLIEDWEIKRNIDKLIFHCTATQPNATITSILKYWKETLKWENPGYHIIIDSEGKWTLLQDFNLPTNGVAGHNSKSLHISYIGGIDRAGKAFDSRTAAQKETMKVVYQAFKEKKPDLTFHGHYEFSNKACPSFRVDSWIAEIEGLVA